MQRYEFDWSESSLFSKAFPILSVQWRLNLNEQLLKAGGRTWPSQKDNEDAVILATRYCMLPLLPLRHKVKVPQHVLSWVIRSAAI